MFGHLLEVGVGQKIQQIVHRRIFAAPVPERHQLIIEVACRLSRQPRKIHVARPLAIRAVTRSAGKYPRSHRIGRLRGGLRSRHTQRKRDRSEQAEDRQNSMRHRVGPISTTRWNFCTSHQQRQRGCDIMPLRHSRMDELNLFAVDFVRIELPVRIDE
jgi:hypothetical protein